MARAHWLLTLLLATSLHADEYPIARLGRYARYVKDTVQTDLSFISGQSQPGTYVKRHRHTHHTDFSLWRGRWHVQLHLTHPPDELLSGQAYTIPLSVSVLQEGDDPLAFQVTAKAYGLPRARISMTPSRITKKRRGEPPVLEQGQLVIKPRLDWDADEIGIEVSFTDGAETTWAVARYAWWSNQLPERHHTPRRRDLDPVKP